VKIFPAVPIPYASTSTYGSVVESLPGAPPTRPKVLFHKCRSIVISSTSRTTSRSSPVNSGIHEVEDAASYPNEATEHFPVNIISIGTMIHSQIQQSSNKTSQRITNANNLSKFNYITISDSVVGSLNLGEIKKIDVSMAVFKKLDNEAIIKPLKELTEAIINEKELDRELKNEILEQLSFLSIQANLQKEQRVKRGIIKPIFDRIKTVISTIPALISLWDKLQPLFDKFFS